METATINVLKRSRHVDSDLDEEITAKRHESHDSQAGFRASLLAESTIENDHAGFQLTLDAVVDGAQAFGKPCLEHPETLNLETLVQAIRTQSFLHGPVDVDGEGTTALQLLAYAATPGLSTASSSRDNSVTPRAETPAAHGGEGNLKAKRKDLFARSEALTRALESKNLSEDFLQKFRTRYPGLLDSADSAPCDENGSIAIIAPGAGQSLPNVKTRRSKVDVDRPPFACPSSCPGHFDDVASLREHIQTQHLDDYVLCKHDHCHKYVRKTEESKMTLAWHYRKDHGQSTLQCTEHPNCNFKPTLNEKAFIEHVQSHKLRCHICLDEKKRALPFGSEDALGLHIQRQHGDETLPCNGYDHVTMQPCSRRFPTEGARTRHMGAAHKGRYMCPSCFAAHGEANMFETERALALHMYNAHEDDCDTDWARKAGKKRFKCPRCDKVLVKNSNLQKHLVTHTGVVPKPYKCSAVDVNDSPRMTDDDGQTLSWKQEEMGCETRFATKQALIDHVRQVHFGLLRWEAYRKAKNGRLDAVAWKAKRTKPKPSPAAVLSGVQQGRGQDVRRAPFR